MAAWQQIRVGRGFPTRGDGGGDSIKEGGGGRWPRVILESGSGPLRVDGGAPEGPGRTGGRWCVQKGGYRTIRTQVCVSLYAVPGYPYTKVVRKEGRGKRKV